MKYLFVCVSLLASSYVYGQTDIVSWSSIRLQTKTVNGYRIALAPIVRHNNDLSSYANSSLDVIIRKSFGQGFSAQFLYRHWWMKDSPNRVFWWFDFGHGFRISDKWRASNRVRWHIAKDYLVDEDPNFIRWIFVFQVIPWPWYVCTCTVHTVRGHRKCLRVFFIPT